MQAVIYTKTSCPFCTKAKELFKATGITYEEQVISSIEELPLGIAADTVPQIIIRDKYIGGYTELEFFLKDPKNLVFALTGESVEKERTVFNKNATGHETGNYPLFLGEDLGFADNINQPYPILETLYDEQMGQIWNHTEIDLTQDRQDMLNVDPEVTDLMVKTLLWQTLTDSVVSRAIGSTLTQHISNSSLQDLYNAIINFESIHSKTYLHIIRQTMTDPVDALRQGYANIEVVKRSDLLINTFDNLANAKDEEDMRKLVLFCVVVLYLLESINFMASFAVTFAIAETGVFQGISQNVALIARDEMLHARAGRNVLNILRNQWPDTWAELQPEFGNMLKSVVDDEFAWADYLFSEGRQVVGLNSKLLKEYIRYMAAPVADTLDVVNENPITNNPLPYMDSYIDTSKIQVANQELQNGTYLINSVKASPQSEIDEMLKEFQE